jgi:hypothetical protein
VPILTAADFDIEDDEAGIGALIDSVANDQHKTLRTKAVRAERVQELQSRQQ